MAIDWNRTAESVASLLGIGGLASLFTRWLMIRKTRQEAVDGRYDTLLSRYDKDAASYQQTLSQLRNHIDNLLQNQTAQLTQLSIIQAEAQSARDSRARMHEQYEVLAEEHAALKREFQERQKEVTRLAAQLTEAKARITESEVQQLSYQQRIAELEAEVISLRKEVQATKEASAKEIEAERARIQEQIQISSRANCSNKSNSATRPDDPVHGAVCP